MQKELQRLLASALDEVQLVDCIDTTSTIILHSQEITHRLSEANCVELVQKLMADGLVKLYMTTQGREYITPDQIEREVSAATGLGLPGATHCDYDNS